MKEKWKIVTFFFSSFYIVYGFFSCLSFGKAFRSTTWGWSVLFRSRFELSFVRLLHTVCCCGPSREDDDRRSRRAKKNKERQKLSMARCAPDFFNWLTFTTTRCQHPLKKNLMYENRSVFSKRRHTQYSTNESKERRQQHSRGKKLIRVKFFRHCCVCHIRGL